MNYSTNVRTVLHCSVMLLLLSTTSNADQIILEAPDSTFVIIDRDSMGVPHIFAETEFGLFFGQGYASTQDRGYQMELYRRTAEGKLSEWFGSSTLALDTTWRKLLYTAEERTQHFNNMSVELQAMFSAYTDGVNALRDSMLANPDEYLPLEFYSNGWSFEPWTVEKSVAIFQYIAREFGRRGGEELERLAELQEFGQEWLDLNMPINDSFVPTTIPDGSKAISRNWHYSGMQVNPKVVERIRESKTQREELAKQMGLPYKYGSFAVLVGSGKSSSGSPLLLGCPQMIQPQSSTDMNRVNEAELYCPTFHAGGMSIAGVPTINIGHTENFAWTFTSSLSDNTDVYIDSTMDESFTSYWHNGTWHSFEVFEDTILIDGSSPFYFTHYRTVHGPVFGADLSAHQTYSYKITMWGQELELAESVYDFIDASNLSEFEAAIVTNSVGFNVFYADKNQDLKFWHTGLYQDRSDGVDPRLPHKGDGSEEWGGMIPFDSLPQLANPAQDYFVNWNNKPVSWWDNGDQVLWRGNSAWAFRVNSIDEFVNPISSFTFDDLKQVPPEIPSHGTYQQAIEINDSVFRDDNIVPPGQSAFVNINGQPSPHRSDQWNLHLNWQFKDMIFHWPCSDTNDVDNDHLGNDCDNCPDVPNFLQFDYDLDGIGDACDSCTDTDGDGYGDPEFENNSCVADNCPDTPNPDQSDADNDGIGDACCCVMSGDLDQTSGVDVADLTFLVDFLFGGGPGSGCPSHGDVDDSGGTDVADLTYLVDYLFRGGAGPVACQ